MDVWSQVTWIPPWVYKLQSRAEMDSFFTRQLTEPPMYASDRLSVIHCKEYTPDVFWNIPNVFLSGIISQTCRNLQDTKMFDLSLFHWDLLDFIWAELGGCVYTFVEERKETCRNSLIHVTFSTGQEKPHGNTPSLRNLTTDFPSSCTDWQKKLHRDVRNRWIV